MANTNVISVSFSKQNKVPYVGAIDEVPNDKYDDIDENPILAEQLGSR